VGRRRQAGYMPYSPDFWKKSKLKKKKKCRRYTEGYGTQSVVKCFNTDTRNFREIRKNVLKRVKRKFYLPGYDVVLGLFFDPEDGGDMFLRNVGCLSTDYTALHHRRHNSS
jgi:hypothetical protein